jgi:transposase-like protein
MPAPRPRVFSREFKEVAVRRILAGEKVKALAAELQVWPKLLPLVGPVRVGRS